MSNMSVTDDGDTLVIRIPMQLARYGACKRIVVPRGEAAWAPAAPSIDSTLVKAIARAFRWRRMIESGAHVTVDDIAIAEKINPSYVSRVLRLSLLAPEIVEAILDGRHSPVLSMDRLLKPFQIVWSEQQAAFEKKDLQRAERC